MKPIFLFLLLHFPLVVFSQTKVYEVRVEQALLPNDTLKLSIIAEKTSGADFNILTADFGLFVSASNLDINNARTASPVFASPGPYSSTSILSFSATRFGTGPGYVYVGKSAGLQNNVVQPNPILISSTPTVIEEIFIPITNPAGTNTISWRLEPMAIITDNPQIGKAEGDFIVPSPNFALDSPCDLSVTVNASRDTVLLGWFPKKSKLTTTVTDANGPVSYFWSNGATTANQIVEPAQTTTYTVTATDTLGCQDSAQVTVAVQDVRCGKNNNKVLLCKRSWFTGNRKTVCVKKFFAFFLVFFGAEVGPCETSPLHKNAPAGEEGPSPEEVVDESPAEERIQLNNLEFVLFPNPSRGQVTLAWKAEGKAGTCYIDIYTTTGRRVYSEQLNCTASGQTTFRLKDNAAGVYKVNLTLDTGEVVSQELLITD